MDAPRSAPGILGLWDRLRGGDLEVDPGRCAVLRNRRASCRRCAEACPSGCIGVVEGRLSVEPRRCLGCGACAAACPTGALAPRDPDDAALAAECAAKVALSGGAVAIACERVARAGETCGSVGACGATGASDGAGEAGVSGASDAAGEAGAAGAKPVVVRCLARVDEGLLVGLVADGANSVALVRGDCAACLRGHALRTVERVVANANELLAAWGRPGRIALVETADEAPGTVPDELPAGPVAPDASAVGVDPAAGDRPGVDSCPGADDHPAADGANPPRYTHVGPDGTLPHALPPRRRALLDALGRLGLPSGDVATPAGMWGRVLIDRSACISCRGCSVFCPTGALARFAEDDGAFGLVHEPSRCVACMSCRDACPYGALAVEDAAPVRDVLGDARMRFDMDPPAVVKGGAYSILNSVRAAVGNPRVYER